MTTRELFYFPAPPEERRARGLAAALLRATSRLLDALAEKLALVDEPPVTEPVFVEYYGDAGAPEGALYVNGKLVGHVLGVTRL